MSQSHQCQLEPLEVPSGSTEALGSTRKTAKKSGISNLAAAIQEESSSSPTTLPRTQKPDNAPGIGGGGSVKKKSMILKPVEFGQAAAGQAGQQKSSGLTNLQQLIGNFWGVCEKNPSFFLG